MLQTPHSPTEAELQDTASSQDTHNLQPSRAYIRVASPELSLSRSPHPSLSRWYIFSREGLHRSWRREQQGPALAWRAQLLKRDAAATNGALLEWELRQGTGPRAGAPRRTKTLLLGTFPSKQSPEPLVPGATEEWIPPRDWARRYSGPLQVSRTQPSPAQTPH